MKSSFLTIFLFILTPKIIAQHVALKPPMNPSIHELFAQLAEYRNLSNVANEFMDSQHALSALFNAMSPTIKSFANYTGLFRGNCSVFFEDTVETVNCDFEPCATPNVTLGGRFTEKKRLPTQYWHQITLTNILLAKISADWRRGKLQEFESDLYFKQNTCTQSAISTLSVTDSQTSDPTQTESNSISETICPTPSQTPSNNKTSTQSINPSVTETKTNFHTHSDNSFTSSDSAVTTRSPSFSYRTTNSSLWSISFTGEQTTSNSDSRTTSQDNSQSISRSAEATLSKSETCFSGILAIWNQTGGTYADETNQASRYLLSSGVVTDSLTGLHWEQSASTSPMTWNQALAYCSTQTTGSYNDWQLPNIAELQSLVDYTASYQTSSPGINPVFSSTPISYFWSSTLVANSLNQPWFLSFGNNGCYSGLIYSQGYAPSCTPAITNQAFVRCVRPSKPISCTRYSTTTALVMDNFTGLIWQRVSTGGVMASQASALSHCASLNLAGSSNGWRLPTAKELSTLIDYHHPPNLNPEAFPGEPSNWYWTSSVSSGTPTGVWNVGFGPGTVDLWSVGYPNPVNGNGNVRCIACSIPLAAGILTAWVRSGGTYADATNQASRYAVTNGVVTDSLTELQWQQTASSSALNQASAINYCQTQTTGSLSGWRVPNIAELQTLTDYTMTISPYMNTGAFPSAPSANFWSSTGSWTMYFATDADASQTAVSTLQSVRCVRSCYQALPTSRYVIASGTVTDVMTGLTWQQISTGGGMTQSNAAAHCSALNLAGFSSGWRLPTIKELATLIDYGMSSGLMMNAAAFNVEPASYFWSSTGWSNNLSYQWHIDFSNGNMYYGVGSMNSHYARCVR